ncbi:MAG: rod shape-determining protein MreD [Gemmatimonadales bacterium]|nr:MAG: rod shape-determining protein MreD [Gemmatimonadales bacterium]
MRPDWGYRAILVALPLLHFTLHVGLGLERGAPDLLAVGLLLLARELRTGTAAGVGFMLGLLEDAFSLLAFGANALACTLLGIVGSRSRELFLGESVFFLVSYLFLGTWLRGALHWLLSGDEVRSGAAVSLLINGPVDAAYATAVGVALLFVTGAWRTDPRN